MEVRDFAKSVLLGGTLEEKLTPPAKTLTDDDPGQPLRPDWPMRPPGLNIAQRHQAPAMPKSGAFHNPARRGVAHHVMANHELQAAEVMAMILLAFPGAPSDFRLGLAGILAEEQRHTKMHARRAAELGVPFGSLPVSGYIWDKSRAFASILDYLAGIPLTLEQRNLDHSREYEGWFLAAGDRKGAGIVRTIHRDEIGHVAFGLKWLRSLKPVGVSDFDAWQAHLHWPLQPARAVAAAPLQRDSREAAGLDAAFLDSLEASLED